MISNISARYGTLGAPRFAATMTQSIPKDGGKVELYDDIVILGGARTPFVKSNKTLQDVSPFDLLRIAMKGALDKASVKAADVNQLIMGNIIANDEQSAFLPRQVALALGMPQGSIASTSNRVCGTGFEVARLAAHELMNGGDSIILTGGVENMSQTPVLDSKTYKTNPPQPALHTAYNPLVKGLTDPGIGKVMFQTADELASRSGVSRQEADDFSAASHQKADAAIKAGRYNDEIVPVKQSDLKNGQLAGGQAEVTQDEHLLRPTSTGASMGALKVMDRANPKAIHTPGSSSGVVDGAAALLISTGKLAQQKGIAPLAHLKGVAVTGCDPEIMGIGPARAMSELLKASNVKLDDVDIVEVNEAFGGQALSVAKELAKETGSDYNTLLGKLNPDGGAIAIGHPLAASGSRIMLHSALQLKAQNKKFALVGACIGGGQGIAALIKKA